MLGSVQQDLQSMLSAPSSKIDRMSEPVNQTHGDQIHFSLNDYTQYHKWAFLMKGCLDDHGEWNEEAKLPKEGKAAFRLITKNFYQNSIDLIMDTTSSVEAWQILAKEFAGTSIPTFLYPL